MTMTIVGTTIVILVGTIIGLYLSMGSMTRHNTLRAHDHISYFQRNIYPLNKHKPKVVGDLTSDIALELIEKLAKVAGTLSVDWIVGVNTGGRIAATILTEKLRLPHDRCIVLDTEETHEINLIESNNSPLFGNILIVDDICRTGNTLFAVDSYIKNEIIHNATIENYWFAALVVADANAFSSKSSAFPLDWVGVKTQNKYIRAPWTAFTSEIRSAYARKNANLNFDENIIQIHKEIGQNFDTAFSKANSFFPVSVPKDITPVDG